MPHQFAKALDNPLRLRYRNPSETLGMYGFVAGMTVMDAGCGTGLFTVDMARMVGAEGVVHALDIQAPMLRKTEMRVHEAGVAERVRLHHCGLNAIPLADDSVDVVVLIATLPQVPDRQGALLELRRVLKPGARIAVSEELPDPAYVPSGVTATWLEDAGFRKVAKMGNPFCYSLIYINDKGDQTVGV
jgi:ubiquinone/menaquinone biosynthesis C-methylase UbiE